MKRIDVSTPKYPATFALVDDSDYEWLNQWKWSAKEDYKTIYAHRCAGPSGKRVHIKMHRLILGCKGKEHGDHRDCNGLNNQRCNLRSCSNRENNMNQMISVRNTSGYKGVYWNKASSKWTARIKSSRKRHILGHYFCIVKAAKSYDKAARKYFGEFARLNFPLKGEQGCKLSRSV
ncbi:Fis family transcriptional regulator [Candidatus Pacearchaeota archaeon]|nr:Fis family transcriptional regulator [Candidatus Pacearchaeota archaeon]